MKYLTAPLLDACLSISTSASYVRRRSEYLSSSEVGQSNIVLLAKKAESIVTPEPLFQLTVQEQGMFKYCVVGLVDLHVASLPLEID